jgi:hypothetical protein
MRSDAYYRIPATLRCDGTGTDADYWLRLLAIRKRVEQCIG